MFILVNLVAAAAHNVGTEIVIISKLFARYHGYSRRLIDTLLDQWLEIYILT